MFLRVWACSACLAWSRMSLCEHGRRRRQSDECGSASICEHGRQRYLCKDCGGKSICCCCHERRAWSTAATAVLRARSEPQPVQGVRSQQHLRAREAAQRLQGVRRQQHLRARATPYGLQRMRRRQPRAAGCEHGRQRSVCKSAAATASASTGGCAVRVRSAAAADLWAPHR